MLRELLARVGGEVVLTRGSTYDNLVNLAPDFVRQIVARYEGTRLGRQELMAEILEDVPGALWTLPQIEALRLPQAPDLVRVVVAIDPAATANEDSEETGIVVAGRGRDGQGYVLADVSVKASPDGWGRRAAVAYQDFAADRVVYEANQGGDMVKHVLKTVDPRLPLRDVHASRGKRTRAEPIAALYEQGRPLPLGEGLRVREINYTETGAAAFVISRNTVMAASGQTSAQIAHPVHPSLKVCAG